MNLQTFFAEESTVAAAKIECKSKDVATECKSKNVATECKNKDVATECKSKDVATECKSKNVATECKNKMSLQSALTLLQISVCSFRRALCGTATRFCGGSFRIVAATTDDSREGRGSVLASSSPSCNHREWYPPLRELLSLVP